MKPYGYRPCRGKPCGDDCVLCGQWVRGGDPRWARQDSRRECAREVADFRVGAGEYEDRFQGSEIQAGIYTWTPTAVPPYPLPT